MTTSATPGPVEAAEPRRGPRRTLPGPSRVLSWLFAGRLVVGSGLVLGAVLESSTGPAIPVPVAVAVFLVTVPLTAYGYWAVQPRRRSPGEGFYVIQALVDLGLITALVHFTGGSTSAFTALYVLVIAAYTLLVAFGTGMLVTVLASMLFFGEAFWSQPVRADLVFWGQVGVFIAVFAVIGQLAARLRQAGVEQASLQTELQLVRLEADDILRNISSGVLTIDGLGRLAFINPMAERLLQLDGRALTAQPVLDRLKVRSPELWAAVVAAIRHGRKVSRGEGNVHLDDGRVFPIGLSTTTFERDTEQHPSVTAIFTDISDSKRLQELHLRAERLEAVAALSASLAHEIRNPLASIRSSVEQLSRSARADDDERFLAQLIVRESDRLSRILSEFLDFSRVRATRYAPVDLRAVAEAAAALVREHPAAGPGTEIRVLGERTIVEGDEDLLHRVVVNLVLNAVQAAEGRVTVTVTVGPAPAAALPQGSGIESPVRLEVRDDGPGIPEELRDRLFEPFVTGRAGGTGLGLSIVQRAVAAHRGLVLVDTVRHQGTTFTIFLPAKWSAEEAA
ncbi:MAG TPA: ATP-binding protein [Gemmatimonadales bacterium]|nr:ATP-binding protein [Gemmatimonadales bacterium]